MSKHLKTITIVVVAGSILFLMLPLTFRAVAQSNGEGAQEDLVVLPDDPDEVSGWDSSDRANEARAWPDDFDSDDSDFDEAEDGYNTAEFEDSEDFEGPEGFDDGEGYEDDEFEDAGDFDDAEEGDWREEWDDEDAWDEDFEEECDDVDELAAGFESAEFALELERLAASRPATLAYALTRLTERVDPSVLASILEKIEQSAADERTKRVARLHLVMAYEHMDDSTNLTRVLLKLGQ